MLSSWVIDREIFLEEATALRARFDAERGVSNAKAIRLLKVGFVLVLFLVVDGWESEECIMIWCSFCRCVFWS